MGMGYYRKRVVVVPLLFIRTELLFLLVVYLAAKALKNCNNVALFYLHSGSKDFTALNDT